MLRTAFLLLSVTSMLVTFSQRQLSGVVANGVTREPLPFATVRTENPSRNFITTINGRFDVEVSSTARTIQISYVSFQTKNFPVSELPAGDTIFLYPVAATLGEVIVRPQADKVRQILNAAVRNKPRHNPELYDLYQCNIYYKMKLDLSLSTPLRSDSSRQKDKRPEKKPENEDAAKAILRGNNHLLFSETFSKRFYVRPQQLQDVIMASRFSGLKKTYFANLVTDILPFHVYSDYISLSGNDYLNPVAKGWQKHYDFFLADELADNNDTTYILSFSPKPDKNFRALTGLVYINKDGYAISHFVGTTTDTAGGREIRLEQVYQRVQGKWFPAELNFDLVYGKGKKQMFTTFVNGRSVIDSVFFTRTKEFRFDRAYTAKLDDSVDLRNEQDWNSYRHDTLSTREANTYRVIDSFSQARKIEKLIAASGKFAIGRIPIGFIDVVANRFIASNDYEGTRLGLGFFTNERLSEHLSVGGWMGYGFKDKVVKYGYSGTWFVRGNRDNWLRFAYEKDYRNSGNIQIHPEVDRTGFRNWILSQVDEVNVYSLTAHGQTGYLTAELSALKQTMRSLYANNFTYQSKNYTAFDLKEINLGLRFAYGEKRIPLFGYYFPIGTKYPVAYLRTGFGTIDAADYSARFIRSLAAITYSKRINRWGKDAFQLEAGLIHIFDDKPISRSFLLAAKGFRSDGLNFYAWGGLVTMRPSDYSVTKYASLFYKHDFEKNLWKTKYSRPYVSIAHNLMYGDIQAASRAANVGVKAPVSGYHESGLLLNQILQKNFIAVTYVYLNVGAFYHWSPAFNWKNNGVFVVGISTGF